ncbi:MAG: hypothetical protein IPM46_15205 [Flavobacteriales bacterium]|nr:hypothetical protein [Flavobacteriales bacterium]
MCGIAGYHALRHATGYAPDLQEALRCIAHRGPDDEGVFVHEGTALGHRRLSIIDTSSAGHQPFTDEGGRYTIIFNGEAFNFKELRAQLLAQGERFRSNSDTEVVLRLFALKGPGFLHEINGFFALAIHDKQTGDLFLARDRFGVKPLLYGEHQGRFLFASELRAMLALGLPRVVDPVSLRMFFTHYYIPAPFSILRDVRKVPPGHAVTITEEGASVHRWYDAKSQARSTPAVAVPQVMCATCWMTPCGSA